MHIVNGQSHIEAMEDTDGTKRTIILIYKVVKTKRNENCENSIKRGLIEEDKL